MLADDLIWATRLADLVRAAGADPCPVRSTAGLAATLPDVDGVIVDLTARAYDGVAAISTAVTAGVPVLAVGQHDDVEQRRRALAAGATRVHPYRRMFEDGEHQIRAWLEGPGSTNAPAGVTASTEGTP